MAKTLILRNSEVSEFRDCQQRWGYRWVEGLGLPEAPGAANRGSAFHVGMASFWSAIQLVQSFSRPVTPQVVQTALTVAQAAGVAALHEDDTQEHRDWVEWSIEHVISSLRNEAEREWQILGVELPFRVELARGLQLEGTIDLVVRDVIGVQVIDWKTTSGAPQDLALRARHDGQSPGYIWAARKLFGAPVSHFSWIAVRRKLPAVPRVNKNGKVSAALCDTLSRTYARALTEQAMDRQIPVTAEQNARLAALYERETHGHWLSRSEHFVADTELKIWHRDLLTESRRIRQLRAHPELRVRNWNACNRIGQRCPFAELCVNDTPEFRETFRHATTEDQEDGTERGADAGGIGGEAW